MEKIPGATKDKLKKLISNGITMFFNNYGKQCAKKK
jgi:hypothetical protein